MVDAISWHEDETRPPCPGRPNRTTEFVPSPARWDHKMMKQIERTLVSVTSRAPWVFVFGDGHADGHGKMKDELGGKGAGLAEMTNAGLPVPPGFTIQTKACREFMLTHEVSEAVERQMMAALARLEKLQGQKLGPGENPMLVSVRSGSKFSMPGTMDTILNLVLNYTTPQTPSRLSSTPPFPLA